MQNQLDNDRKLTEAEEKRLARDKRTRLNRRGRKDPSAVPARLTRTSAFAPRRYGTVNANIERVFHVPGHSVVLVKGGELGSVHRDMIYALFRLKSKLANSRVRNPLAPGNGTLDGVSTHIDVIESVVSWRDLLLTMGKTQHVNNVMTMVHVMEELRSITMTIYDGDPDEVMRRLAAGRVPHGRGQITGVIDGVEWDGVRLDSKVRVRWGRTVMTAFRTRAMVSLNAEVQFALKSEYAKSFWPFIDSNPTHVYIDETMLASLISYDLFGADDTNARRSQFRKDCRQAFDDMVKSGGLRHYTIEELGSGRMKVRRYHYKHALPTAAEKGDIQLDLLASLQVAEAGTSG
ncbi:hypothetical protein VQ03_20210 [Methylobacterium tarhaniae]|uniref:Replication protein n=1 Tax=Methylobacterium tarhaniae TaxID=1187852 RepID=A0A0J6ST07_9HYPH|nr:hypothetical protein [Methylobacterium tarhaniae]KMO36687.1 hypothetical protein VQ03_20210 [Methylobacterium tarhaniae]